MSWVGNVVAAVGAISIAKFNKKVYDKQAALARDRAKVNQEIYDKIERPRLVKQQKSQYADFFVSLLRSGAEFRLGDSTFYAAQAFKVNQATDLAINDYNQTIASIDAENQSLLLEARGDQEMFKGFVTATGELAKAGSKAYSNKQNTGSLLG